jgi:hypothetical protein
MDGYDTLARLASVPERHDLALSALPDAPVRLPRRRRRRRPRSARASELLR